METFQQKKALRRELREVAGMFSLEYVTDASEAVCASILQSKFFLEAHVIFGYLAFQNEINVDLVLEEAIRAGKIVAVPRIISKTEMQAARLDRLNDLPLDRYGIRTVPDPVLRIEPAKIDLVLVPGAGFSLSGFRIGRGAGYYDRFLIQTRGYRMGITCDSLLREEIPVDKYDQRVDALVTETKFICCTGA